MRAFKFGLPVRVNDLPAHWAFQPDGKLRDKVRRSVDMGITKVIAGPEKVDVIVDIKRPYYLALS